MDNVPLVSLILYSIPESILIFTFGFIIWGTPIKLGRIFSSAILSVVICYYIRGLPLPFGIHTLIGILVIFLLFKIICNFSTNKGLVSTLSSLAFLLLLENTVLYTIQISMNLSLTEIHNMSSLKRTLVGYPQLVIWSLITYYLYRKKFTFLGVPKNEFTV